MIRKSSIFNPVQYVSTVSHFVTSLLKQTDKKNVIVAVSGGIDSATALYLLNATIPIKSIFVMHLYYYEKSIAPFHTVVNPLQLPKDNILLSPIKEVVDIIATELQNDVVHSNTTQNERRRKVRLGNIMARIRMIYLFDQAKKLDALVCGTENRTENFLGYFTRFGDAASDFEVINHLYKTEVRALAKHLHVPQEIIDASPSAGLWEGQTDEKELGFTYEEIDAVLGLHFDERLSVTEIEKQGYKNVREILKIVHRNQFKHEVPYLMERDSFELL